VLRHKGNTNVFPLAPRLAAIAFTALPRDLLSLAQAFFKPVRKVTQLSHFVKGKSLKLCYNPN